MDEVATNRTSKDDKLLQQSHKDQATEVSASIEIANVDDQHSNHRNKIVALNSVDAVNTTTIINDLENQNDEEGDDSDESSDSSSVDDGDPFNDPVMTLMERRAFNIERNHKLLSSLGMMNNEKVNGIAKIKRSRTASCDDDNDESSTHEESRGMIIPSCWANVQRQQQQQQQASCNASTTISSSLSQLQQRYPHRSVQIRKLYSLISVPIHADHTSTPNTTINSPPIIVTGPSGCGKTSIVRDVVAHLCMSVASLQASQLVLQAYVDCTTLDHINIDEFISSAYTQWYQQAPKRYTPQRNHNKPKSKQRTHVHLKSTGDNNAMEEQKRVPRMRQAKARSQNKQATQRKSSSMLNTHHHLLVKGKGAQEMEQNVGSQSSVLVAMWSFGRSIQRLLGRIRHEHPNVTSIPLILIVDHAELLLCMGTTYSKSSNADRINFMAQLMMLPRALGLNLTLIFITKNILLEHTALNNMNSQGTIQGHICPITIRFPAYRKKSTFQTILLERNMKSLIAGTEQLVTSTSFYDTVYKSFLETLIQGLSDLTSDIKEYLRLGRGLWPLYISPLLPENIEQTIIFVQQANVAKGKRSTNGNEELMESDLLPLLDQKFFPHLRHALEYGFGVLCFDSSGTTVTTTNRKNRNSYDDDLPILVKYLLLAAYICHRNRQDKDRHLFSIERNGRKRRKTKEADNEEEMAYGTTGSQQDPPKTIRPRTFPLERLYSLYVSIVSLNASKSELRHHSSGSDSNDMDNAEILRSLGNIRFLETITYLRDIGVLHEFPKASPNEPIRFSQRSLWTTISQDEAQDIAKSVNFPLDRYIL